MSDQVKTRDDERVISDETLNWIIDNLGSLKDNLPEYIRKDVKQRWLDEINAKIDLLLASPRPYMLDESPSGKIAVQEGVDTLLCQKQLEVAVKCLERFSSPGWGCGCGVMTPCHCRDNVEGLNTVLDGIQDASIEALAKIKELGESAPSLPTPLRCRWHTDREE